MKTLLAAAVVAALSLSTAARAGALVDVSVIDRDTGSTLPTYVQDGKIYIAGMPGHRYGVRLRNHSDVRVLAVLSVDGVNAVSGESANPEQSGYVLGPHQDTEVNGWRKSLAQIAQFNFTNLGNSYAARTGRPDNVGVIGVAVFREKPLFWREGRIAQAPPSDRYRPSRAGKSATSNAQAAPSAQSAESSESRVPDKIATGRAQPKPEESLGTGHGAREDSEVTYTKFVRASSQPDEIDSIWYDSYRNLVARGVIIVQHPIAREPQPFPNRFVPDPAE